MLLLIINSRINISCYIYLNTSNVTVNPSCCCYRKFAFYLNTSNVTVNQKLLSSVFTYSFDLNTSNVTVNRAEDDIEYNNRVYLNTSNVTVNPLYSV